MKIRIDRVRMATGENGRDYAYDVLVPTSECPQVPAHDVITVCKDKGEYYRFPEATMPAVHWAMERGWDRYEDYKRLESAAQVKMLELAKSVFPELAPATVFPSLWVSIPDLDASHETRYTEVTA